MLIPLRQQNLHPIGSLIPAPEDQRIFLKRRKGFVSERRDGPREMPHWVHPPIPPKPVPLRPEIVASRAELLERANARANVFSDEEMLLLLAA